MKCRHPISHRYRGTGYYDLVTYRWVRQVKEWCAVCEEHVPLGPSSDTDAVELEIWAAEVALSMDTGRRDSVGFWAGWDGSDDHCGWKWDRDRYAAGALARAIYDHGKEDA